MARIYLSPLIVDIRAKQADTVFSKWRGINYIRSRVIPANPKTDAQVAIRNALKNLVSLWQGAHYSMRINRNGYATGKPYSGFNSFLSDNIVKERDGNLLVLTKDSGFQKLESLSAGPGSNSGELNISWSPNADSNHRIVIMIREAHSGLWVKTHWQTIGNSCTITGLESGKTYEVYAFFDANKVESETKYTDVGESKATTGQAA